MINDQKRYKITSRKKTKFSRKIHETISCNQKDGRKTWEYTISEHRKCIWEDNNNRTIERIIETVIIEGIKVIKEHITEKIKKNRSRRIIIKVAQQVKSNVDNGGKMWEI